MRGTDLYNHICIRFIRANSKLRGGTRGGNQGCACISFYMSTFGVLHFLLKSRVLFSATATDVSTSTWLQVCACISFYMSTFGVLYFLLKSRPLLLLSTTATDVSTSTGSHKSQVFQILLFDFACKMLSNENISTSREILYIYFPNRLLCPPHFKIHFLVSAPPSSSRVTSSTTPSLGHASMHARGSGAWCNASTRCAAPRPPRSTTAGCWSCLSLLCG